MSRYIDADILSDALRRLTLGETDVARATMKITHYVCRMPTADVRENVKGEWIDQEDDYHHYWECSECGMGVGLDDIRNYCPNCGADMRGEA